tara:strand:+ start:4200 stop:5564 length:1365 start_codon:yes stop_codon:yes gene_type:complete
MAHTLRHIEASMTPARHTDAMRRTLELLLWAALAFIAAQRFTAPSVAGYICLLPWAAAIVSFKSNVPRRNALLLLALLWSTDNAVGMGLNQDGSYGATPGVVRYLVYVTVIVAIISNTAVRRSGLIGTSIAALFYLAITAFFADKGLSGFQMARDCLILALAGLIFSFRSKNPIGINLELLMFAMTGYLLSECVNFFIFGSVWYGEYMNYSTTKYLIVLPSLIALLARRPLAALGLIALTVPVLVGYTHRTLFLAYIVTVLVIVTFFSIRQGEMKRIYFVGAIFLGGLIAAVADVQSALFNFKSLALFDIIQFYGTDALEMLDPVRYASSAIYFQLPLFELLFGRGFGSGMADPTGALNFVRADQSAFSIEELSSGYFFSFHDVWVDIGLRFGLLPLGAFLIWFARQRPADSREGVAIWFLVLIGIISAFYGTSGLVSLFFLLRVLESYRTDHA